MSVLDSETAGHHIDRVTINAAKEAGVDTSGLFTGATNVTKYDIPLGHLDFKYIESCNDVKELEKIYKILKSGSEGHYPDLEVACEKRVKELAPKSRVLRKEEKVKTKKDLQHNDAQELEEDLESWSSQMKSMEDTLAATKAKSSNDDLPPIRGSGTTNSIPISKDSPAMESSKNMKNKRVQPRDYKEWDKFDLEAELDKAGKEESKKPSYVKPKKLEHVDETISSLGMTRQEIDRKAEMEKNKGNEYFASQEYDAAILYYSRSLSLVPSAASYNNRALAYLKLEKWNHVVTDCNHVLQMEEMNIKAYLRRGSAYKGLKDYGKAADDFREVLTVESHNPRALKLLIETEELKEKQEEKEETEQKTKARRMVIEDVEGSDEEVEDIEAESAPEASKKGRKMVIDEVEDSDSESEGVSPPGGGEQNKMVNGHVESHAESTDMTAAKGNGVATETKENSETKDVPKRTNPFDKESSENKDWALPNTATGASTSDASEVAPPTVEEGHLEPKEAQVVVRPEQPVVAGPKIIEPVDLPADVLALKTEGNDLFRAGQYGEAITKYSKAHHKLHKDDRQFYNCSLLLSNRAACKSKIGDARGCIEDCNESLKLVPHSIKPLLRRAQAYEILEKYKKAYIDYRHVLAIDSRTDVALQGSSRCSKTLFNQDGVAWRDKIPEIPTVKPEDISVIAGPGDVVNTPPSTPEGPPETTPEPVVPEKTAEEKFLEVKNEGAAFVQKQEFKKAIDAYTTCIELFPDRAVSYTNRALCYLRLDKAVDALNDCSEALKLEPTNVKAYFRRAQAKKMLKLYKVSMEDLLNLLKIDNKNTPARKELDIVQKYYKEELLHQRKEMASKQDEEKKQNGDKKQDGGGKKQNGGKQRKKLIIEEVNGSSDEEEKTKATEKPTQKQMTQKNKQETKTAPPSEGKRNKKDRRKGGKVATAPTLSKKTPYEFMHAWNSLKKSHDIEQYAKLIEQIRPQELPKLISNKLESNMLTVLIKCVQQHFLEKDASVSYNLLFHLQKVDRFKLVTMFVPEADKTMLNAIFDSLTSASGVTYSQKDVETLKGSYNV
ncbi:sperm-associated antigen 1-like isoform X2 [Lineus longissimus]|uniref:sperm-associated antigen 1-like isoform X2 n=1 Tax=Lineus longissimus TaxID=88925 RepID=UPI00315D8353